MSPTFTDCSLYSRAASLDVRKIEIENHGAVVDVDRNHQIRVHVSRVAVDHQIGILPEIPGAVTFARGSGGGILAGSDHRTRLQAVTVFVLDGVLLVIEDGIQSFVQMRHVISAVEIVVDKNLPVAMNVVDAAIEVVKFADAERRDPR